MTSEAWPRLPVDEWRDDELETAILCPGKPPEKATAHALLAQELVVLKRSAEAKKHLEEAIKLDPENADAKLVNIP